MSSFLRPLTKSSASATRGARISAPIRSFHSPFAVLGPAHKTQQNVDVTNPYTIYEKQYDFSPEPVATSSGTRTYVVSQPDASASHYEVPSGAYPTSSPYVSYAPAEAPSFKGAQVSSTSSSLLAHEFTTSNRAVPYHLGGVGESSAIRYATAPGEMGKKGGSNGGLGMMDWKGVVKGGGELDERNLPPDDPRVVEKFAKAGLDEAWKLRR
ncbi:hypothetical protein AN958_05185 [Leucoagaricus sp. SymC.cos]|nr:hypothetical protein AN958_05185 [Leucoagaricus sp. SymC.cos]